MRKLASGIYPRASSIRIFFVYNDEKYFETLRLPPTPANLKYAMAVRKQILRAIDLGTFNFAEFFPESKNAPKTDRPVFGNIAKAWLESKERKLAATTLKEYRNTIETHFSKPFGQRVMEDIHFLDVDRLMSGLSVSNKTFNNILSVLRGVYEYGLKAHACTENYAAKIEFANKEETEPDPLTQEQIVAVLQDMAEHYDEQIEIYFNLAFLIGFRPSEGIDLRWPNLDWTENSLKGSSQKTENKAR